MQIDSFRAADGAMLTRYHWPAEAPRRIVVIAHGMAEHAGRYDEFARFLNGRGCTVWALDHRGHGGSVQDGKRGHFADRDGFERVMDDLAALIDQARAADPSLPLVLLGHSMGSFVSRLLVLRQPQLVDGLVLSAPGFRQAPLAGLMRRIAAWDGRRRGMATPSPLMARLVFGTFNLRFIPARTPFDWLSRDMATVDAYIADRDCGFDCTPQLWQDLFGAIVEMERLEAGAATLPAGLPIWLLAGTHDPVSMGGRGCRQLAERYRALGLGKVEVTLYPRGRHEMFNETNRAQVWQEFAGWLERSAT
ncbi:alpha/beta hydrolase [Chitinimonas koreensis]|uniref:alpha/beta hydrolase n=1 Tax=Chitinimonas koreensis TaxID=356302 RepID=UPI0004186317|nr:alpha/beta hydrolase [Chitinimonas koreensis]QNM96686.1 lysophospholipase [Chitinimonas koreensis]